MSNALLEATTQSVEWVSRDNYDLRNSTSTDAPVQPHLDRFESALRRRRQLSGQLVQSASLAWSRGIEFLHADNTTLPAAVFRVLSGALQGGVAIGPSVEWIDETEGSASSGLTALAAILARSLHSMGSGGELARARIVITAPVDEADQTHIVLEFTAATASAARETRDALNLVRRKVEPRLGLPRGSAIVVAHWLHPDER